MRLITEPRLISILIAILVTILLGLTFGVFSDDDSNKNLKLTSDRLTASPTNTIAAVEPTNAPDGQELKLLAICSGMDAVTDVEICRKRFQDSGNMLSLGERVIFIPNVSVTADVLQFSVNGDLEPILISEIDAILSQLEVGKLHSVRIRHVDGKWSNPIDFQVSLQQPGAAYIYGVCADLICAPAKILTSPLNADAGSFYPLVELVSGLTDPPTEHMWVELMLNADESFIGCLNCQAAEAAQFSYENRKEFGVTGVFYNWDLSDLTEGTHTLRARLRNKLYAGSWSPEFVFEVSHP